MCVIHLNSGHGDGGRSGFGDEAVRRASLHHVSGVGHEPPAIRAEHKVLSESIDQDDHHPLEQLHGSLAGVRTASCRIRDNSSNLCCMHA